MNESPNLDRDDQVVRALLAPLGRVLPVSLTDDAGRSGRSYLARRLVPVFVLAAAALAVGLIAPWGHGSSFTEGAVAERALVAIGNGPVLHAVLRSPNGSTYVDLATGQETPQLVTTEVWYDRERRFVHRQDSINGQVYGDLLAKPFNATTKDPRTSRAPYIPYLDPALVGLVDGYRPALENGDAHITGTGAIDGHRVTWIELTFFGNEASERIAVDRASSRPIRVEQFYKGKIVLSYDVVSIETLPEGSGSFSKSKRNPSPTFNIGRDQVTSVSRSDAARALPGALWIGESISTLRLSNVSRATLTSQNLSNGSALVVGTGIELHYGDGSPGLAWDGPPGEKPSGSYVLLHETEMSASAYWPTLGRLGEEPPTGSMLTDCGSRGDCGAFMVKNGIHVAILASSRKLLFEAAHALEPIPASAATG